MADRIPSRRKKHGTRMLFFWEGKLHRLLRVIKPANLIEAYRFEDKKEVVLLYTDYVIHAGKAYSRADLSRLLGLSSETIKKYLAHMPDFPKGQRSYNIESPTDRTKLWYTEENIYQLHEILLDRHCGRPRFDGKITPLPNMPSRAELKARIEGTKRLYIETDNGLVPLFEQAKW